MRTIYVIAKSEPSNTKSKKTVIDQSICNLTTGSHLEIIYATISLTKEDEIIFAFDMKPIEALRNKRLLRATANGFTMFRLGIGLPVMVALINGYISFAWILILFAGFSDFADGQLARKAGGGTTWGARIDPLADKILLLAPLMWLANNQVIPIWAIWLLTSREIIISNWRSSEPKGGPASVFGKTKTILQFISTLLMLWPNNWGGVSIAIALQHLGFYLFWPSLFLALISCLKYLKLLAVFDH